MKKVFLKFNRTDISALICLMHWLEIFKEYKIYIICDLFKEEEPLPPYLEKILSNVDYQIKNTNYSLRSMTDHIFTKSWKVNASCANLTCFEHLDKDDKFLWLIDADDTMFLTKDYDFIRNKFITIESILKSDDLDGISLDFYREAFDQWSFGVCLLNSKIDFTTLQTLPVPEEKTVNLDSSFDVLRKLNKLKLKSFVIDDCGFQHLINKFPGLPGGIYYWKNKKLWDIPLKDDILIL